jgi:tetratricopeptide (TPR) repeat protein
MALNQTAENQLREAFDLDRAGRVPEAIEAYQRILARFPTAAEVWYNLAVLQRRTRQADAALASYRQALAHGVSCPEEVHLNLAVLYTDFLGQHAAAERELDAALALNRRFVPALLNRANLHADFGRREPARALLEEALAVDPRCHLALARLADLERAPPVDPRLLARLRGALAAPGVAAADCADLGFALGRLLDLAADYPAAFAAYAEANRASRASAAPGFAGYDRRRHEQFIDRLIASPAAPAREAAPDPARPRPIFICGMFRSGSTLAEQLLADCAGVAAGGELDFLPHLVGGELAPYPEALGIATQARLAELATGYLGELAARHPGAAWVTDKRPDNYLYIGLIKSLFPDARIVHTTRDPLDNCLSIFFLHLDHQMAYALDLMDIGHYFREYRRLMAHWRERFGADIFELNYDALVRGPDDTLRRLGEFLGLGPRAHRPAPASGARAIKTASVWQVRQPLYRSSSGRATHYATELVGLAAYLRDLPPA